MRGQLCIWALTSSTLSGVVVDIGGGVLPGADVIVKNDATGISLAGVTNLGSRGRRNATRINW
jgi:hypothetical protein